MSFGPKTFAPVIAAAFVLWPIIAYMGGQGFTAVVAIAAIYSMFYVRVKRIETYAIVGSAFVLWVLAASFWAPESQGFLTGNVFSGSFSMEAPGVRFGLLALAGLGVLVATGSIALAGARLSLQTVLAAAVIQFAGVVVTALFMPQILALLAPFSHPISEMPQNLMRNANAFAMMLPLALAWLWHRETNDHRYFVSISVGFLAFAALALTGTQSAVFGLAFMLCCMAIVKVLPKNGFKVLFTTLAFYIVSAPALLSWGVAQLRMTGVPLPKSFFSRSYSWELVGGKIAEAPLIGHGPEASQSWRDTFGDHPAWLADATARYGEGYAWEVYRVVPIHPHNMSLQIWAETGMIGAVLAATFLFFLGWRIKAPEDWSPVTKYAAAGLIGICAAICSFAYSMWNEAFWATVVLAVSAILLHARHQGGPRS